jgi:hypothetical protein
VKIMGYYINPPDCTKEHWLATKGTVISRPLSLDDVGPNHLPVCLVDNGPFRAAGIAYSQSELDAWNQDELDGDRRPRTWYRVSKEALAPYLPAETPAIQVTHFVPVFDDEDTEYLEADAGGES